MAWSFWMSTLKSGRATAKVADHGAKEITRLWLLAADEARAGLPSQGSSPKLPFTFKATLHQQQPAEGPAEHCLHSDPELPVVKIDFKGAPAGVSLIEEAAGPATFAAEGQPGSRSGEQMLPQGLFIMANGQFSSLPCASDQGKIDSHCCICTFFKRSRAGDTMF